MDRRRARAAALAVVGLALAGCGQGSVLRVHVSSSSGPSAAAPTAAAPTPVIMSPAPTRSDPVAPSSSVPPSRAPSGSATTTGSSGGGTAAYPGDDGTGLPPVIHRIDTTDPVVFVTIDDGSTRDPRVLDLLRSRKVPVTAFLTASEVGTVKAQDYFREVQSISRQTVQDHSIDHPDLLGRSLPAQTEQVCRPAADYTDWFGTRPWLFRPPYGSYDDTTRRAAAACGMRALVLWDVSLPHAVLRYAGADHLRPGDIILTHWRPDLYRDLAGALDEVTAAGLRVAALQDYLPAAS